MTAALGKYRLDARLGGGGMAEVFAGHTQGAEGFARPVAIKRVLPGFSDNAAFASMFIAEAQLSARLLHPNIVAVLDFDRDAERRLFLVMELVEGKDLDHVMALGPLPIATVIFVTSEVLRGLGYAHDLPIGNDLRGLVHRDVSPHNVLLSWEGAVKVSDFGIAKARSASEATASVFIKGKPAYMSPEQASGAPLDGRSDLFAVGVMMWEMLVGRRLFVGEDTRATVAAVLFSAIPRPRTLRPEVPRDVERVVMKLLERDVPTRYATAEAAIDDLLACSDAPRTGREGLMRLLVERFPGEARVRQSTARAGGRPSAPPPIAPPARSLGSVMNARTTTTATPPRRRSGRRALVIGALLVGSGAAAFAVVAALSPPRAPRGWLDIDAPPSVRVLIDGAPAGPPPLHTALPAGPHEVEMREPARGLDLHQTVTIRADQTTTVAAPP